MFAVIQRADVRAQLARLSDAGLPGARDHLARHGRELAGGAAAERHAAAPGRPHGAHPRQDARRARPVPRQVTHLTLTGTSNTTCGGLLYNDEVMLRIIDNPWLHDQYLAHFDDAYAHAHQSTTRVMPVMKPCRALRRISRPPG